jgi:hypothetical protein
MTEAIELPSTWSKVGQSLHANSLWMLLLVGIERVFDEHPYQAAIAGAIWLIAAWAAVKYHVFQELTTNHRRRRQLLTWALIIAGAVLLGAGIYRLAIEQGPSSGSAAAPAAVTDTANVTGPAGPIYIKNFGLNWDSQSPLSLVARAAVAQEGLRIFVEDTTDSTNGMGNFGFPSSSILVADLGDVVEGQSIRAEIISTITLPPGSELPKREALIFGKPTQNATTGATTEGFVLSLGLHVVRLFLLPKGKSEPQNYKFVFLVSRDDQWRQQVTIIGAGALDYIEKWRK